MTNGKMIDEFIVHDSTDEFKQLLDTIETRYTHGGYVFGQKSNDDNDKDFGHWAISVLNNGPHFKYDLADVPGLLDSHPEIKEAWDYITKVLGHRRSLFRVYFNGYTYGSDGTLHYDDPWIAREFGKDVPSETCIIYLNKQWDNNWAGETVVFDEKEEEIVKSVVPKHGRLFIFNSLRLHGARPVTRVCPVLRKVLVFKTGFPEMNSKELDFLRVNTTSEVFQQSYYSMRIAESRKANKDVCAAVLYHFAYETEQSRQRFTRELVSSVIGEAAEKIVHTYHTTQLADLLDGNIGELGLTSRMALDTLSVHFAVLIQQNVSGQHTELIERIAARINEF